MVAKFRQALLLQPLTDTNVWRTPPTHGIRLAISESRTRLLRCQLLLGQFDINKAEVAQSNVISVLTVRVQVETFDLRVHIHAHAANK